ncbi:hypothetical protein F5B22DRAFT_25416 [Xylaria bambusicola]|uniref:uncharacterized protein n=1 Tax=Xylaria bambusicola TaxID=326684 RepID=UPI0020088721|nr:uncharacterized protein F5B22DRAFT_25416 [Xylaria bambusicola]KAI0528182.1 hypothetical protein F5B22DRAFT_25416 [Xylaria bambusicola]
MGLTDGLLGPVLGGLLSFLGAIAAAVIAFSLSRRNRNRERLTDEEHTNPNNHELGFHRNSNRFCHQGIINGTDQMQHGTPQFVEHRYFRALEESAHCQTPRTMTTIHRTLTLSTAIMATS